MSKTRDVILAFFGAGIFAAIIVYILQNADPRLGLILFGFPISFSIVILLLYYSTKSEREVHRMSRGIAFPVIFLYGSYILMFSALIPYLGLYGAMAVSWIIWIAEAVAFYYYLGISYQSV
jgi:hypothetical protein